MTTNTTNTTKDPRPEPKADAAIDRAIAPKTPPSVAVQPDISQPDLESRIKQRRAELIGKLGELKVDVRHEAAEARDKIKASLSELAHLVKWGIVDGWASVSDAVTRKLEQWLAASERQLAAKQEQP